MIGEHPDSRCCGSTAQSLEDSLAFPAESSVARSPHLPHINVSDSACLRIVRRVLSRRGIVVEHLRYLSPDLTNLRSYFRHTIPVVVDDSELRHVWIDVNGQILELLAADQDYSNGLTRLEHRHNMARARQRWKVTHAAESEWLAHSRQLMVNAVVLEMERRAQARFTHERRQSLVLHKRVADTEAALVLDWDTQIQRFEAQPKPLQCMQSQNERSKEL